jgi:hypothetical protein
MLGRYVIKWKCYGKIFRKNSMIARVVEAKVGNVIMLYKIQ